MRDYAGFAYAWQEWAAAWSGTARLARSAGRVQLLSALAELAFAQGGGDPMPNGLRNTLVIQGATAWVRAA